VVHTYPFKDRKGKPSELKVCEIHVDIDNTEGRASAIDADMTLGVKTPDKDMIGKGVSGSYISSDGDRKLRRFFGSSMLPLCVDEVDTLYDLADTFSENLLCQRITLPKGGLETALIGYGIEGFSHVLLGEFCFELPLEGYVLAIVVGNNRYGDLHRRYFKVSWHLEEWSKPKFTEFKPKFTKRMD
jgi:hypothetical protein